MQPDRPNAGCDYGDRSEPSAPDNVAAGVSAVEFALILAAGAEIGKMPVAVFRRGETEEIPALFPVR